MTLILLVFLPIIYVYFMCCCVWFKLIFELFILFYVNNFDLIRNIFILGLLLFILIII